MVTQVHPTSSTFQGPDLVEKRVKWGNVEVTETQYGGFIFQNEVDTHQKIISLMKDGYKFFYMAIKSESKNSSVDSENRARAIEPLKSATIIVDRMCEQTDEAHSPFIYKSRIAAHTLLAASYRRFYSIGAADQISILKKLCSSYIEFEQDFRKRKPHFFVEADNVLVKEDIKK